VFDVAAGLTLSRPLDHSQADREGEAMNIFLSYHFERQTPENVELIQRVCYHLRKQEGISAYCYCQPEDYRRWRSEIGRQVRAWHGFVLFLGRELGTVQRREAMAFRNSHRQNLEQTSVVVHLPGHCTVPDPHWEYRACMPVEVEPCRDPAAVVEWIEHWAEVVAKYITDQLCGEGHWVPSDAVPVKHPFSYEKEIIETYVRGKGRLRVPDLIQKGCPLLWPTVDRMTERGKWRNPVSAEDIGSFRPHDDMVLVDTRSKYHQGHVEGGTCLARHGLVFPEAGPREDLYYPTSGELRVGVLVSGGIAPGINAVIASIVERHCLYHEHSRRTGAPYTLQIRGYTYGLSGLMASQYTDLHSLDTRDRLKACSNQGGSLVGTSRFDELLETRPASARAEALERLIGRMVLDKVNILYIIGGDGSMRAAHSLSATARRMNRGRAPLSVVAIPKTTDNDILWVWQSFGFLSAVEKAKQFALHLHTEASSNPRLCVVQLFGSDSGFVVSHAALASGVCDAALIPEAEFTMYSLSAWLRKALSERLDRGAQGQGPSGLVLMAENAIPKDIKDYFSDKEVGLTPAEKEAVREFISHGSRVYGQTPDDLRSAGLKVVSRVLERDIQAQGGLNAEFWSHYRVFTNEPRHLIRAIDPSVQDVISAQRLGALAVDNAMAGYHDFMISQWLTEFVLVPLELVTLGRKRVPKEGIFWKSVLASTHQPPEMNEMPPKAARGARKRRNSGTGERD
jgi:6-phosphofructokinase 1